MSGGVDSGICADICVKGGNECAGATMRLHNEKNTCGAEEDSAAAKHICDRLGIEHFSIDCCDHFREYVIKNFVETYEQGGTPNPCVECNRHLKFDKLLAFAEEKGYEYIATGHYADTEYDEKSGRYLLKKAKDRSKDQSYVLYTLTQYQLAHTVFPLANLEKTTVRVLAEKEGYDNYNKSDSQDICFVPDSDYAGFIERFTGKTYPPGDFVDLQGERLGVHNGIIRYTVGKRKGLGIASTAPLYVTEIIPKENKVVLSHGEGLFSSVVYADNVNLIKYDDLEKPIKVKAKLRYRQKEQPATAVMENGLLKVVFNEPQRAATKGQSLVLYEDDYVVGGGRIIRTEK